MNAQERRAALAALLAQTEQPLSASALAERFAVSRQIIVGDVALLRASGVAIVATPRGYVLQSEPRGLVRRVACRHSGAQMEAELNALVDQGCTVLDVIVEHPVYGQLTGPLHLSSRYDVSQFIAKSAASDARPLSALTEGLHLHTLSCPDEAAYARAVEALRTLGVLWDGL